MIRLLRRLFGRKSGPGKPTLRVVRGGLALGLIAAFVVAGCSIPGTSQKNCADVLAQQLGTTKVVKGSFECLSPDFQNYLHASAISNDAELARAAGVDAKVYYAGQTPDGYVYVTDDGSTVTPWVIHLDKNGRVDKVS